MKVDSESQLFLFLVWLITVIALLAAIYLLHEARVERAEAKEATQAPYVIPRQASEKPRSGLVIPPPPF